MSLSINETFRKLLEFTQMEVNTDELQRPPYESYAQWIQEIRDSMPAVTTVNKDMLESVVGIVRETMATLVRRRIDKIMRSYQAGKEIPPELLFSEEKRFLMPFLELGVPEARGGGVPGPALVSFRRDFTVLRTVTGSAYLGPFSQFDVAVLPRTDAEDLSRKGIVDIVR